MFTLLDGLNRFLGYFNLKIKVKNRLYIVLGTITTAYIGYLTWNFFHYNAYGRGIVYLLIFLILVYFLFLNVFYYFFDKNVKWDITPLFEKFAQVENLEENKVDLKNKSGMYADKLVIYDETKQNLDEYQAFDTTLEYLENSSETLEQLTTFMLNNEVVEKNTRVRKKKIGKKHAKKERIYEVDSGISIPSFTIELEENELILSIGLNATEREKIAQLKEIGGISATKMQETYDVVAKSATIMGGVYTDYQNGEVKSGKEPYTVQLQVACLVKLSV